MAKLSGKLYFIVGLGVLLLSYLVNLTRENKSFVIFMIVGAVFIVIGIIKEITSRTKSIEAHDIHLHHGTHNPVSKKTPSQSKTTATVQHKINHCKNCGMKLRHYDHFCPNCGTEGK